MRQLPRSGARVCFALVVGVCAGSLTACREGGLSPQPHFRVPLVNIEVPKLSGWVKDPDVEVGDPAQGGTVMRLLRENAPVGSPRIEFIVEQMRKQPSTLEAYLHQNLRQMGDIESQTSMRINRVEQEPFMLGPRRAYFVRHEYTIGKGAAQASMTQLTTVLVVDGRGVTVTALGRTELLNALSDPILRILKGIEVPTDRGKGKVLDLEPKPAVQDSKNRHAPLDLGAVGGK